VDRADLFDVGGVEKQLHGLDSRRSRAGGSTAAVPRF
jgi:hypothetical protein